MKSILYNSNMSNTIENNINPQVELLKKEVQEYTNRLNFLRNEATRLEGVILYIQNQIAEKSKT
jgi:hypothetical protein